MSLTEGDYESIKYFWESKEDPTRWAEWEEKLPIIERDHPELIKAMQDFEVSRLILDLVIKNLGGDDA